MRNAYKRPARPEGEPQRANFVCACCGRTVVTAVEGLYYNPAVGSKQRFCDAACRQAVGQPPRADTADNAAGKRDRRDPTSLGDAHMTLDFQVAGQPGLIHPAHVNLAEEAQHHAPRGAVGE